MNMKTNKVFYDNKMRLIYLQFPYFNKKLNECETLYHKLIYAIKNMYTWDRMPSALKEQVFEELERLVAKANLTEADYYTYQKAVDRYSVDRQIEEDIKNRGIAQGRAEGIELGIRKTAINLKRQGIPIDVIVQATGISREEIEKM